MATAHISSKSELCVCVLHARKHTDTHAHTHTYTYTHIHTNNVHNSSYLCIISPNLLLKTKPVKLHALHTYNIYMHMQSIQQTQVFIYIEIRKSKVVVNKGGFRGGPFI